MGSCPDKSQVPNDAARASTVDANREGEERFRILAENIAQFAWMADDTGYIFWYNRRWFDYTGTTLEQMQGWGWTQVHHPDHVQRVVAKIRHCFDTGESWEDTFPLRGKDGNYRWFLSRALPIRDENGRVVRWFGTNTDVTEQREVEEFLRASQERQKLKLELLRKQREMSNPLAIMQTTAEAVGRYLQVDRVGFFEISGDIIKFLVGWTAGRLPLLIDDFPAEGIGTRYLAEVRAGRTLAIADTRTSPLTADSHFLEISTISLIGVPILRSGRWHAGLYVNHSEVRHFADEEIELVRDIAEQAWDAVERARAEAARDEAAEQLTHVLEATTDAVLILDPNWQIIYMNPRANEILARSGKVLGTNFFESFPAANYPGSPYLEHYNRTLHQGTAEEFEACYPEPLNVWLFVMSRPLKDGIVIFFRDITEQKRSAAALIQAEKLAAVGRLASSIAHEINNPLESVTNLLYLSQNEGSLPRVKGYLSLAQQELARVTNIATQTLRFHRQSTSRQQTSVRQVLDSVLTLLQGRINNTQVRIEKRYESERPILAYEGDLRQVFANLVGNALDACSADARIILRVREGVHPKTAESGMYLTVADTGHGMSQTTIQHIFDPFFTTKSATGTGLGLWISAEILQSHRATTRVRSSQHPQHHGTVFTIFLPTTVATR